jgi:hypothetical protein
MNARQRKRLDCLLAERATHGLDHESGLELAALLAAQPELDDDRYDVAAAALEVALTVPHEPMPPAVKRRLASLGREWAERARRGQC